MNNQREEQAWALAQQDLVDAQGDYQRLRSAYLQVAREEPGHVVAIAMVGADMNRAYARLGRLGRAPHAATATAAAAAIHAAANGPMARA